MTWRAWAHTVSTLKLKKYFTDAEAEHGLAVVIQSQKLARELVIGADPRRLINQPGA